MVFLGMFEKFRRRAVCSFMSVLLSVRPSALFPHTTNRIPLDGFSCNLMFEHVSKIYLKIEVSLRSDMSKGTIFEDQ